jgi:hypothetical protein
MSALHTAHDLIHMASSPNTETFPFITGILRLEMSAKKFQPTF